MSGNIELFRGLEVWAFREQGFREIVPGTPAGLPLAKKAGLAEASGC